MAKGNGRGMGLGMWIALGVVGLVALNMLKGGGTTVPAGDVFSDIPDSDLFGDLLYI